MNEVIVSMLKKYDCHSRQDYENALKEIVQEIALLGLARAKFFEHAAFYGGTALRILYGLDRFSEDLDFSLLTPNKKFSLAPYLHAIVEEINSTGLEVNVMEKNKTIETAIKSAFIKAGTLNNLIKIKVPNELLSFLHHQQQLKIKIEIDTNPPSDFTTEAKRLLQPIPFSVLSYHISDLFAGKIHAILCRQWKTRVKGRDWYDFVWFVSNNVPVNIKHLKARLVQTKTWETDKSFTLIDTQQLLVEKIKSVDFEQAKQDVQPFLRHTDATQAWSADFFLEILNRLRTQ